MRTKTAQRMCGETTTAAGLARDLGVSPAAVSYALNGRPGLSSALRSEIIDAARDRGLAVKAHERQHLLGLILADIGNPFYSEFAVSISDTARKAGYEVVIAHTDDEPEAIQSSVRSMIRHGVDGVILTVINAHDASLSREFRAAGVPYVQVSRRSADTPAPYVGIDDYAAGRDVMGHLLDHGYRDIAIVAGPLRSSSTANRVSGMKDALRERDLPVRRNRLLFTSLSNEGGVTAAEYLLRRPPLPRAIACGTDAIAMGLLDRLMQQGVRCPEDVAITGYDGLTFSMSEMVNLTTIVQPRTEMASTALAELIHSSSETMRGMAVFTCPYSFHIGRTCGCDVS